MSSGFTDWTDVGVFPAQDIEDGVPIGMRKTMVAGRVAKRPDAGDSGGAAVTEYAREFGLGTLGDIHPWLFWQTKEREKRAMGSWSMAWAAIVTDSASGYYGGAAGVQPLTRNGNSQVNDVRYRVLEPALDKALPWAPEGMLAMVMPATDETEPGSTMLNGDRRLVAAGVEGPGECGTTIVDMQPAGVLCMDESETPGRGGRHARLHGLVRVIALEGGSAPALGGADLNGIALNYGVSQQDSILGFGMVYGPAASGGGPTTGVTGPATPGASSTQTDPVGPGGARASAGRSGTGFAGPPGGNGGLEGSTASIETPVSGFGEFQAKARGGHAVGFMSSGAGGPVVIGCAKHILGADKDGHKMTPAHIATSSLFFRSSDQDGPLMFEGEYPEDVQESEIPVNVHLTWDKKSDHSWIGGSASGQWRWYTTVPYIEPQEPPTTPGAGGPPTPGTPATPSGPAGPTGPATPGAGQPGQPGAPNAPTTPTSPGGATTPPPFNGPGGGPPTPGPQPNRPITPGAGRGPSTPGEPPSRPWPGGGPSTPGPLPGRPITPGARPAGVITEVGGSASGRDVGLYGIFHPFNTGFASISLRPQLWLKGAPNFEHNPLLGAGAYRNEELTRPTVLTVRAWGAQNNSGDWDYLEDPATSRARGGVVSGGLLIAPAEFEMEDYLGINSQADTDNPAASTYVTIAPKVNIAFGKPTVSGVPSDQSKVLHQDTATGELLLSELDSVGAATNILKASLVSSVGYLELEGTGAVKVPSGTTAQRPAAPATGMVRVNSDATSLEFYVGAAWKSVGELADLALTVPVGADSFQFGDASDSDNPKKGLISDVVDISSERMASKGVDLVVNGFGGLGDNTNFANFTFDPAEAQISAGSFMEDTRVLRTNDEFLPLNPYARYELSMNIRTPNRAAAVGHYIGLVFYDVDKLQIGATNHMFRSDAGSTLTTLAADLNPGDTVIQITSTTNWNLAGSDAFDRVVRIWGWVSATGLAYDPETYSRQLYRSDSWLVSGDWSGGTVTLNPAQYPSGWDGAAIPSGTPCSQGDSGSSYKYIVQSNTDTGDTDWHAVSGQIGGLDLTGTNVADEFPPGAAYAKVLWLPNWTGTPTELHSEAVSLIEVGITDEAMQEWVAGITHLAPTSVLVKDFLYRDTDGAIKTSTINEILSTFSTGGDIYPLSTELNIQANRVEASHMVTSWALDFTNGAPSHLVNDRLAYYNATAANMRECSIQQFFDYAIPAFAQVSDAAIDDDSDYLLGYDTSAGDAAKFLVEDVRAAPYGSVYASNGNTTGQGLTASFAKVTQFANAGLSLHTDTTTADEITVLSPGTYEICHTASVYHSSGTRSIELAPSINGTEQAKGRSSHKQATTNSPYAMAGGDRFALAVNDVITLEVKGDAATGNVIFNEGQLLVRKVGP